MAARVFMTGFPGFIATRLVDRLLGKDEDASFNFLIEQRLRGAANDAIDTLAKKHPGLASRIKLMAGDISQPKLGMNEGDYDTAVEETTHVWHLAAIYNLAVPAAIAYRVNVVGTNNILDFCEACEDLERLDYVSTCYVSGNRVGCVLERELDEGQTFKNHYESTKCWAEMEVRRRRDRIPTTIHRPSVVAGDSKTGETDKYDGPYYIIQFVMRLPGPVPMVNIGQGRAHLNVVPIDFTVDAMAEIWTKPEALGETVHLANPRPATADETLAAICRGTGHRKGPLTVPPRLLETVLGVPLLGEILKIPKELVTYANHGADYDTRIQKKLLEGTGIVCPPGRDLVPVMVDYVKRHPEKPFLDGRSY